MFPLISNTSQYMFEGFKWKTLLLCMLFYLLHVILIKGDFVENSVYSLAKFALDKKRINWFSDCPFEGDESNDVEKYVSGKKGDVGIANDILLK